MHPSSKYLMILGLSPLDNGHPIAKTEFTGLSVVGIAPGEELIPLLGDRAHCVDKPEFDFVMPYTGAVARICGCIDINSSPALRECFLAVFAAPHAKVVSIDLSAVTFIDSSGVATLIEALKIARSYNTELRLQGLEGRLLGLFQSTGILSLFNGSTSTDNQSGSKAV